MAKSKDCLHHLHTHIYTMEYADLVKSSPRLQSLSELLLQPRPRPAIRPYLVLHARIRAGTAFFPHCIQDLGRAERQPRQRHRRLPCAVRQLRYRGLVAACHRTAAGPRPRHLAFLRLLRQYAGFAVWIGVVGDAESRDWISVRAWVSADYRQR